MTELERMAWVKSGGYYDDAADAAQAAQVPHTDDKGSTGTQDGPAVTDRRKAERHEPDLTRSAGRVGVQKTTDGLRGGYGLGREET